MIFNNVLFQAQLYERIAKAWCVVIPSLGENCPNTCLESMLLGKLILAHSGVGQVEILRTTKGEAGILLGWNVPGDFEQQLKRILAFTPEDILQAGQQARALILAIARLHPDLYRKYGSEIYQLLNQNGASWLWDHPSRNAAIATTDLTGMEILMLIVNKLRRMRSDGGIALIIRKLILLARSRLRRR